MSTLFDAHCHLQDSRLQSNLGRIMARAWQQDVVGMVCCGTQQSDWDSVAAIARLHAPVIPSYGIHPWHVSTCRNNWIDQLTSLIQESPKAVIGEIGLDFAVPAVDKNLQQNIFIEQLRLARKLNRPVAIHCRKAFKSLLDILGNQCAHPIAGMIHSYCGSAELVPEFERLGLYLSFSGAVMDGTNKRVKNAIRAVSIDRLLIESDAPDQKPMAINSPCNSPEILPLIAQACAIIRRCTFKQLAASTTANAVRLFKRTKSS